MSASTASSSWVATRPTSPGGCRCPRTRSVIAADSGIDHALGARPARRHRRRRLRFRLGRGPRGRDRRWRSHRTAPEREGPHRPGARDGRGDLDRRATTSSSWAGTAAGATTSSPICWCSPRRVTCAVPSARISAEPACTWSTVAVQRCPSKATPGEIVTLLPLHGPASGIRTRGPALPARRRHPPTRDDAGGQQRLRDVDGRGPARCRGAGRRRPGRDRQRRSDMRRLATAITLALGHRGACSSGKSSQAAPDHHGRHPRLVRGERQRAQGVRGPERDHGEAGQER